VADTRAKAFTKERRDIWDPEPAGEQPAAGAGRHFRLTVNQALDFYDREHVAVKVVDKDRQRDGIRNL
jgi:hypothetical protein